LLQAQQLVVDYVAAIDPRTLTPRKVIDEPTTFAVAARVGTTRLIDNMLVSP
jgi:pantoate--beta-alanine ligase